MGFCELAQLGLFIGRVLRCGVLSLGRLGSSLLVLPHGFRGGGAAEQSVEILQDPEALNLGPESPKPRASRGAAPLLRVD